MKFPLLNLEVAESGPEIGLEVGTFDKLSEVLARYPEIETGKIYGSRATGVARPGSDIDLAIEGSALDAKLYTLLDDIDALNLPVFLDLTQVGYVTNEEMLRHIHEEGLTIYSAK